jgi:hypothetical protein
VPVNVAAVCARRLLRIPGRNSYVDTSTKEAAQMTLVTTGLTNGGSTTHYNFQYDDSLAGPGRPEPARTNELIAHAEDDFTLMSGWFGNIALTVSTPITVNVSPGSYASAGWGPPIRLTPGDASDSTVCRYLLVSEVTEMFMMAQAAGWFAPDNSNEGSAGEGLSRFLASQFLVSLGEPPAMSGFDLANSWMNSTREDFVNHIDTGDHGIDAKTGCAILFIYYLFSQLGFTVEQIVAAAASELSGVYTNLTGDSGDPFPFFKQLLDTGFPGTSTIGGTNPDNPFPLAVLSFWVDKSTFGRDEVTDVINSGSHGTFTNAFWLVLEGFNITGFAKAGVTPPTLSGAFNNLPGVSITSDPSGIAFEVPSNSKIPQRIRFPFDITFTTGGLASFPAAGGGPLEEELDAAAQAGGHALPGARAATEFELISGADPYFTNINPAQGNVFYLSQDLRVFTATPAVNATPVTGGPTFGADSIGGGYQYIQDLLAWLNDPAHHFTDGGQDPFSSGIMPSQSGALTGDSSVTPFTFTLNPFGLHTNYNFVVARVRLRGTAGPTGAAQNVKVFFRMWSTQSADTDFLPSSTYLSHQVAGKPEWPLPATDSHTIPFFATGNGPNLSDPSNSEYGTNGVNNRTIEISAGGDVRWAYFGCFLNVYDTGNVVNGSVIQALLAGTHHCLVAEIADDDAPIVNANGVTMSPENSDKLAQRNLQLTHSDNPGAADTHRIPQTFDVRPSAALATVAGDLLDYPDELMIDWGNTPPGSIAHIYWPQVNAMQVLALATKLYGAHVLTASDAHTIDCVVTSGVTYVPIPQGAGESFAGLLTVDLPQTVVTGEEFNIVVRRVATRQIPRDRILATRGTRVDANTESKDDDTKTDAGKAREQKPHRVTGMKNWRYVVGTFHVRIPVTTPEVMLRPDEDTLAIMKWRLQAMPPSSRWTPVLKRYIEYLSARVKGLGGDPDAILPSLQGAPHPAPGPHEGLTERTGKVVEVVYDCFGDLEGFVLGGCCERYEYKTRERAIGELVLRACRDRLLLTVVSKHGCEHETWRILVRS